MAIFLANHRTSTWEANNDICVQQHMVSKIAQQFGEDASSIVCRAGSKLCGIMMQVDGWFVEAHVTKSLYEQPELICKITKEFLQKYTVRRDDLLKKREGNE